MIEILFLTVPNCVQCAKAKKVIEKVGPEFPGMKVEYIDVTQRPEFLQQYRIMSSPGIVVNGKLEYSGGLEESSFRELLKKISGKQATA